MGESQRRLEEEEGEEEERARGTHRRRQVEDLEVGLVPQVVDLGPVHGHAAPRLDEREPDVAPHALAASARRRRRARARARRVEQDELLGLVKVADVALLVDAAREVARPGAVPVAARHEAEQERAAVDRRRLELEDCERVRARCQSGAHRRGSGSTSEERERGGRTAEEDGQDEARVLQEGRTASARDRQGEETELGTHIVLARAGRRVDEALLEVAVPEEAVVGRLPQGLVGVGGVGLLLEAGRDVVAAVREVEGGAVEVALDEAEEVGLVGELEEVGGRLALERVDAKVGGGVDGRVEDGGDFGALCDDDEVVGVDERDEAKEAVAHEVALAPCGRVSAGCVRCLGGESVGGSQREREREGADA